LINIRTGSQTNQMTFFPPFNRTKGGTTKTGLLSKFN